MARTFTIYDVLTQKGAFSSNPANAGAMDKEGQSLYSGPIEYPKMMYHPTGAYRVTKAREAQMTVMGPIWTNEHKEIISEVATSRDEEVRLRRAGWHDHPAKAIAAGGGEAPPMSSSAHTNALEKQIAELSAQLAKLQGADPGDETLTKENTSQAAPAKGQPNAGLVPPRVPKNLLDTATS